MVENRQRSAFSSIMALIKIAHMNYARLIAPMEDDIMSEFRSAMGPINSIAKSTPGFIWSFDGDVDTNENGCTKQQRKDVECLHADPLLFPQLSLWKDVKSIQHFAFKSGHNMYYRRRKEWFVSTLPPPYSVCWWHRLVVCSENGHTVVRVPTLKEAFDRCERLRVDGPTQEAFDFATSTNFPMPSF